MLSSLPPSAWRLTIQVFPRTSGPEPIWPGAKLTRRNGAYIIVKTWPAGG